MKLRTSLNPNWPTYLAALCGILSILSGIARLVLLDRVDSKHCHSLKTQGQWLDNGFKNWQPEGCMMHTYKPAEAKLCLSSKTVAFVGDSTVRSLFYQFANLLDASLPSSLPDGGQKHSDQTLHTTSGNILQFSWDPFLNASATHTLATANSKQAEQPALLVLGGGLWYLRYSDNSGGLPAWEKNMESLLQKISRLAPADEVVILPVQEVEPPKLSQERLTSMRLSDIDAMNSDLFHRVYPDQGLYMPGSPIRDRVPLSLPAVFNKMLDDQETSDGLHYSDSIIRAQATLLLNLRCNDALPKRFPFDKTCCNEYPWPRLPQGAIILFFIGLGPVSWALRRKTAARMLSAPFFMEDDWLTLLLSVSVALIYVADRTSFWLKEQKQFDPWSFGILNFLALAGGIVTSSRGEKDLGFLNREQTDEWKGWMQIAILIYHYLGASKISGIYNPIRVLVASYLFQTGYGHTTYYLKKADFGFKRVAQVMIRLNFLTVLLAYTMDTDYLFYYFAPLCSFWFLVIYATLFIGHQLNDRMPFLIGKIFVSAGVVTWFMKADWPLAKLFDFLGHFFAIRWDAREWAFRVTLDLWIVYVGIAVAIGVIKIREFRLTEHPLWQRAVGTAIGLSIVALLWFFGFELYQKNKFAYNGWHPYISFLPILAFVVLRNANATLRSSSSMLFMFIGKCSLETFIIQYHFWLAGDTKGLLQIIPGTKWRPFNAVFTSILFIYLSHHVAIATGAITQWFCNSGIARRETLPITAPTASASNAPEQIPLIPQGHPNKEEDQHAHPPATPTTPRWLERLSSAPPPRVIAKRRKPWWDGKWSMNSLEVKLLCGFGIMWTMNLLWSYDT